MSVQKLIRKVIRGEDGEFSGIDGTVEEIVKI
jgi:hypothetical protein